MRHHPGPLTSRPSHRGIIIAPIDMFLHGRGLIDRDSCAGTSSWFIAAGGRPDDARRLHVEECVVMLCQTGFRFLARWKTFGKCFQLFSLIFDIGKVHSVHQNDAFKFASVGLRFMAQSPSFLVVSVLAHPCFRQHVHLRSSKLLISKGASREPRSGAELVVLPHLSHWCVYS
ncbi:hypothetical protein KC340_g13 [Hortaea werneckii]|nr:hypothetical protein KC340_g13 [Hortaea werneckii]